MAAKVESPQTVAGLDGCRAGWVCLVRNLRTGIIDARILGPIEDLLTLDPQPFVALVDIPIGLPDAGARICDVEARKRLRPPRASSVFPTPVRSMLVARTRQEASALGVVADGRKISIQAWCILPKIREADAFLQDDVSRASWVREVHPEVSFQAWNAGKAMQHKKRKREGRAERESLVRTTYGDAYLRAVETLPRGTYAKDDLLDAFAALWSAERVALGSAEPFPSPAPVDSVGLRMEMVV